MQTKIAEREMLALCALERHWPRRVDHVNRAHVRAWLRMARDARRAATALAATVLLSGCALAPSSARVEISHDSHSTAGAVGCHSQCAEDGLTRASILFKWRAGPVTLEAGEGWNLQGRNGGGFYGPAEVFTARAGYEIQFKR